MSLKLPDITDMRETVVLQFNSGSGKLSSAYCGQHTRLRMF